MNLRRLPLPLLLTLYKLWDTLEYHQGGIPDRYAPFTKYFSRSVTALNTSRTIHGLRRPNPNNEKFKCNSPGMQICSWQWIVDMYIRGIYRAPNEERFQTTIYEFWTMLHAHPDDVARYGR